MPRFNHFICHALTIWHFVLATLTIGHFLVRVFALLLLLSLMRKSGNENMDIPVVR
jgi:hypothetical protein